MVGAPSWARSTITAVWWSSLALSAAASKESRRGSRRRYKYSRFMGTLWLASMPTKWLSCVRPERRGTLRPPPRLDVPAECRLQTPSECHQAPLQRKCVLLPHTSPRWSYGTPPAAPVLDGELSDGVFIFGIRARRCAGVDFHPVGWRGPARAGLLQKPHGHSRTLACDRQFDPMGALRKRFPLLSTAQSTVGRRSLSPTVTT